MKKLNITSILILLSICVSCATYKALPETGNLATQNDNAANEVVPYSTDCVLGTEDSKLYCITADNLMYVAINPYQAVPCQPLDFYAYCGIDNTGSAFWDFKDGTTSTLKEAKKTYEVAGNFNVTVTCTYVDGTQVTGVLPVTITNGRYNGYGYGYGYGVTEIKPGDTSCPRIELNE